MVGEQDAVGEAVGGGGGEEEVGEDLVEFGEVVGCRSGFFSGVRLVACCYPLQSSLDLVTSCRHLRKKKGDRAVSQARACAGPSSKSARPLLRSSTSVAHTSLSVYRTRESTGASLDTAAHV